MFPVIKLNPLEPEVLERALREFRSTRLKNLIKTCKSRLSTAPPEPPAQPPQPSNREQPPRQRQKPQKLQQPKEPEKLRQCFFFQDKSSHEDFTEERNPLNQKYKAYMDKITKLTPEEITKFVKKNKNDYEKLIHLKNTATSRIADIKDLFKCNPFNSEQQLAMYLTLREIFNVPRKHFKECRHFFTVIMPEISCQLFAETFRIKVPSAARLIKKLYPKPVSPF